MLGFQKKISVFTIMISILALVVAVAAYFRGNGDKFVPLTEKQFNAEKDAGFSFDQIVSFEQVRKLNN